MECTVCVVCLLVALLVFVACLACLIINLYVHLHHAGFSDKPYRLHVDRLS